MRTFFLSIVEQSLALGIFLAARENFLQLLNRESFLFFDFCGIWLQQRMFFSILVF
jgi:hypothetical protein